jgi:transposase
MMPLITRTLEAWMPGAADKQGMMLLVFNFEDRIHGNHSIRRIKLMAGEELKKLSSVFNRMYCHTGRPSVPPELILKSLLLIVLYFVRSEKQFCEQLEYYLLFRWFLDMNVTE